MRKLSQNITTSMVNVAVIVMTAYRHSYYRCGNNVRIVNDFNKTIKQLTPLFS